MDLQAQPAVRKPVIGFLDAKVDAAGRIKLPVKARDYLNGEPVFTTTLDEEVANIYPLSTWESILRRFAESKNPEAADNIRLCANDYGSSDELDSAGRLVLPSMLRKTLGLENQAVRLECFNGAITIYRQDLIEARRKAAAETKKSDLAALRGEGII